MTYAGLGYHVGMSAPHGELLDSGRLLSEYLAGRDEYCPRCGYNLRDLTGPRCPECGDELRLAVALVEPRLGPFLALVAACAIGFGGSALFGLLALKEAPLSWWGETSAILMLVQWVLTGAALALVLRRRRAFRAMAFCHQRLIAVGAWAVVLILSAAIVLTFDS